MLREKVLARFNYFLFCFSQNKQKAFGRMLFHLVIVFFTVFLQLNNGELTFKKWFLLASELSVAVSVEFPNITEKAQYRDFYFHNRGAMQSE